MNVHALDPCRASYCVFDFETTGLSPGRDRVVEVTMLRYGPEGSEVVLDTLINPVRRMSGTETHGITDEDVRDAPSFRDVVPELLWALSDSVLAAHNAYFDMRFLRYELERSGFDIDPPFICTMYMRPLLGLGKRCSLSLACEAHGIEHVGVHSSAGDALAAAELLDAYIDTMRTEQIATFSDLAKRKKYKFLESFARDLLARGGLEPVSRPTLKKSRSELADSDPTGRWRVRAYQDAVLAAIADLEISSEELAELTGLRQQFELDDQQIRAVHARVFASFINDCCDDERIDDAEAGSLRALHSCLHRLGWAPGE